MVPLFKIITVFMLLAGSTFAYNANEFYEHCKVVGENGKYGAKNIGWCEAVIKLKVSMLTLTEGEYCVDEDWGIREWRIKFIAHSLSAKNDATVSDVLERILNLYHKCKPEVI